MIFVTIEVVPPRGAPVGKATQVLVIENIGPTNPEEPWDSGGERDYMVKLIGVGDGGPIVTHARRDGLLALVAKAAAALS
jgi:hypothetical protein